MLRKCFLILALCNSAAYADIAPQCAPDQTKPFFQGLRSYFYSVGGTGTLQENHGVIGLRKRSPSTLELRIPKEKVTVAGRTSDVTRKTVSQLEILTTLLYPGRRTAIPCDLDALKEHIAVRQNIVANIQQVEWTWPDGGKAFWNPRLWENGTPKSKDVLVEALQDSVVNSPNYGIGCYTAAKLGFVQGIVDFYARAQPNPEKLSSISALLYEDNDPLVNVEPSKMWAFEADYDASVSHEGKLLEMLSDVKGRNFVPGDWVYMINTDPQSNTKTGYEGANAIYLGGGKFSDYFNDHNHAYPYDRKMDEVYQWRNGVFSRSRDWAKVKPLSPAKKLMLDKSPEEGGQVMPYRIVPRWF